MSYEGSRSSRATARRVLGVLLALATAVLLVALSLAQATEEGPAKRNLAHIVAVVSEVDAFLDDNLEGLRLEAEASDGGRIELSGFPVRVVLSSDELLKEDGDTIRRLILTRAADRVYEQGPSAFREETASDSSFPSTERALREGMNIIRPGPHDAFFAIAAIAGGVTIVLAVGLLFVSSIHRGLVGIGLSVFAGTLPVVVVAVASMFALRVAASGADEYLRSEFLGLVEEVTWAPIRNGLVFMGAGASFILLGLALTPRRRRLRADSDILRA